MTSPLLSAFITTVLPLPIDPYVPDILARVRERRRLVVVAAPGAGKTTRVPPALAADGPVILLQPRRVAARSLARRIAEEQGWTLGEEVGWQVRFEKNFTARTRLLVATEGILTARLQSDPLLEGFRTVVLDEFHERSIHADLALALVREAAAARDDLRIVVMSATLDARRVAAFLGGCDVVDVPGRLHPIDVRYRPGIEPAAAVGDALAEAGGDILCFLPGAREIRDAAAALSARRPELDVFELHGGLPPEEQDRALAPSSRRKAIFATNIAETSLTIEGVRVVVDAGLQRVNRYDPDVAIDRLVTERISLDSADQRAGRAGRTAPGLAVRLWDSRDLLREHREPEIQRIDLAATLLEILAWGDDPEHFGWFEAPPGERVESAMELLRMLGAVEGRRLTERGETLRRFPLHPRLAALLVDAGGAVPAARVCALLSERIPSPSSAATTDCDLFPMLDSFDRMPWSVRRAADETASLARRILGASRSVSDEQLLRAILGGFPDRVAARRERNSPRLLLASGTGAQLGRESHVSNADFLVALDVRGGDRARGGEALVTVASLVEKSWLAPTRREVTHRFDGRAVRATETSWYGAILLGERNVEPEPAVAEELLVAELVARAGSDPLHPRMRFAGIEAGDLAAAFRPWCGGRTTLPDVTLAGVLSRADQERLRSAAPESIEVPSGRRARLEYREDGSVVAAVKLQELFGLAETPLLGPARTPVTFELLSPAGRPVQTTRDLRSFWANTYPEVRKELRGRYPKHPWPEDPWTAQATHRAKPRTGR